MMQEYPYKYIKICLLTCWFLPGSLMAQYTAERIVTETITTEAQAELKIENKYGDVKVSTWENANMECTFRFKVQKNDKYDAEEMLDRIQPVISNFGRLVNINSEIEEKDAGFFGRLLSEITTEIDKSDIEIDIDIKVPKDTELEIQNEYGDVVITDWTGRLRTEIRHGDLHVTEAFERANINHNYGRVNLVSVKNAELDLRNVRFKADTIEDLRLISNGSELEISAIDFLNIDSNKDELHFDFIKRLKGQLKFGNAFFKEVGDEIYLELWVTDLRISKVINPAPNIYLNEQNSEIDINIAGLEFNLNADLEGGVFRLPQSVKGVDSKVLDSKSNHRKITAKYGAAKEGKISLDGKKGFIILREL